MLYPFNLHLEKNTQHDEKNADSNLDMRQSEHNQKILPLSRVYSA